MNTIIIVGAGASGLACAVRIKQNNPSCRVAVLERLGSPGKKLLATGNGRCNLSNLAAQGYETVTDFFSSIGLVTRTDGEGRIYPYSNQASNVVSILTAACEKLGVEITTDCTVGDIDKNLCISTSHGNFKADFAVIACGGKAQSSLGSDGSGYRLLEKLGHTITPLSPALAQLTSSSKYPRMLKGQRVKCNMTILLDNEAAGSEHGEALFTDYGLSGIVTMNLSHLAAENFLRKNPAKCHAVLDLIPDMTEGEVENHIGKFKTLDGILGERLAAIIEKQADGDAAKAAKFAKNWKLIITGTKGFDFAQITWGGARLDEFDGCKSKKIKGLYACGEILDRQFECGGFNLNHAFLSGIEAADSICSELTK